MSTKAKQPSKCTFSFQAANIDSLFPVLDAIAWLELPSLKQIAQFAGIDPRTGGKVLKNSTTIGVVELIADDAYDLRLPYPYKGSDDQKRAVVREALVRLPLMQAFRQFRNLGDDTEVALRKAATVVGIENYDKSAFDPLMKWALQLNVLEPKLRVDDLLEEAVVAKEERHSRDGGRIVAFLSHSSKDKAFVRQLSSDLTNADVSIWLDEQRIKVGDSIIDRVSQGLAESDYFLIVMSDHSIESEWVKRELNQALLTEIESREVKILPIKLSECAIPSLIREKKYADFTSSYREGLDQLLAVLKPPKES